VSIEICLVRRQLLERRELWTSKSVLIGHHFIIQIKVKKHVKEAPIYRRKFLKTSHISVTSVTTLLVQILWEDMWNIMPSLLISCLSCLHFYLHLSFTFYTLLYFLFTFFFYFVPKFPNYFIDFTISSGNLDLPISSRSNGFYWTMYWNMWIVFNFLYPFLSLVLCLVGGPTVNWPACSHVVC